MDVDIHEQHGEEVELSPHNVVDAVAFGRRLRALRILQGYDRATEFTAAMRSRMGEAPRPEPCTR